VEDYEGKEEGGGREEGIINQNNVRCTNRRPLHHEIIRE